MAYPTLAEIAANYARPREAPTPTGYVPARSTTPALPPSPADVKATAERDAVAPLLTQTQKMAARYGESSLTIPQVGNAYIEARKLMEREGLTDAAARRVIDGFLAVTEEPPK